MLVLQCLQNWQACLRLSNFFFMFTLLLLLSSFNWAAAATPEISVSWGRGKPDKLRGGRISYHQPWGEGNWFASVPGFSGFWDYNAAYWNTDGDPAGFNKNIAVVSVAPLLRLTFTPEQTIRPYIEGGIGFAALTRSHLGHRDLGAAWSFQDLIGFGLEWGEKRTLRASYHYLHYSNASIVPPNEGIDVKFLWSLTFPLG